MKRVPHWIKTFPYELDREALLQLASTTKNIDDPREISFYIYDIKDQDDADAIADRAGAKGWHAKIDVGDNSLLVLEATKSGYVLSENTYREDAAFFQRLASDYTAHYDGWVASN